VCKAVGRREFNYLITCIYLPTYRSTRCLALSYGNITVAQIGSDYEFDSDEKENQQWDQDHRAFDISSLALEYWEISLYLAPQWESSS
jgi:hypothetical protein